MFNRTHPIARTIAVLVLCLAWSAPGKAGIIPTDVTVTPDGGNFRWTYAVVLPSDMKLQSGDYFIIYNFGKVVPLPVGPISAPSGWTLSTPSVTPNPANINVPSVPGATNLVWTYTGPTIPTGQVGLGNFMVDSAIGTTAISPFVGFNHLSDIAGGRPDANVTDTEVPGTPAPVVTPPSPPPPGVPEPATLALAGLGLPLVALVRRKKRKE
jgi:hypothetical protein